MKKLVQKKNFEKREFRFTEAKLFHNYSKFGNGNEIDIPFENIDGEKVSHKKSNNFLLAIAGILYAISISLFVGYMRGNSDGEVFAWLFWTVVATLVLGYYFYTKQEYWKVKLSNGNYLYFHKNVPSTEATDQFIENLLKARNTFLVSTYGDVDDNLEYQHQLSNFRWLRSIEAISQAEFDSKYAELKQTVKPIKKGIGFGQ